MADKKRRELPSPDKLIRQIERSIARRTGLAPGFVNANPLRALLMIGQGHWPDVYRQNLVAGSAADIWLKEHPIVPIDMQMDALKASTPYVYRKLDGKDAGSAEGPMLVTQEQAAVAALMMDRVMRKKVEDIVLGISAAAPLQLEAPATIEVVEVTAQPAEVILEGDPTD